MKFFKIKSNPKELFLIAIVFLFLISAFFPKVSSAQTENNPLIVNNYNANPTVETRVDDILNRKFDVEKDFRVETLAVSGGAELVTIFANLKGMVKLPGGRGEDVPLISILRDTLGDDIIENDRLRSVWMLSYTKPSLTQKFAAAVPFLYRRTTNKDSVGNSLPPQLIDVDPAKRNLWDQTFWFVFRNLVLEDLGVPIKLATLQYRESKLNYKKSAIVRALAVLALYQTIEGKKVLSDREMRDIQAKMALSDKTLGFLMQKENLQKLYQSKAEGGHDVRGQNWELLRQYSEAEGLYFEPLEMSEGNSTHAIIWISAADLAENRARKFNSRFLNIKSPWNDSRLENWKGYSKVAWFNQDNQPVDPNSVGATPKTMIPLALYGFDFPKIPTLLVDFRDRYNPKLREMSRRVLDDLTKNVLSISSFDNIPYFVGRYMYNFVTSRRGMDINQGSRITSYSQLKLLLSLNGSLNPDLRDEISNRLESVSLNPLENNLEVEVKLAHQQYKNLIEYAKNPNGLPAKLERDRMEEMSVLKHNSGKRILFSVGRVLSLGIYKHQEENTKESRTEMDLARQLQHHERYLREVMKVSVKPEIDSDLVAIKKSLEFIAQFGNRADGKTVQAIAKLFSITDDEQTRSLCVSSLYRINDSNAKKELLALYNNHNNDQQWRDLSAHYLKLALKEEQRISASDAKTIVKIGED